MRTTVSALALVTAALLVSACSTESQMRAVDPAGGASDSSDSSGASAPSEAPTAIPAAEGEVRTLGLATVLDSGKGPELCLGAVAESYPPQCSGLPMTGWDWDDNPEHEEAVGTRWGSFALTGTFDGTTFDVVSAVPAMLYQGPAIEEEEPTTPCSEPEGGWKVVDPDTATSESLDATLTAASVLEGYASAWLDQSATPASTSGTFDPDGFVLNVAVTGDTAAAEEKLRETWGGPLCVSTAENTERELQSVQAGLNTLPGMLFTGSPRPDHIELDVVHDDGSIQAWLDEEYGQGLVEVTSMLVPTKE